MKHTVHINFVGFVLEDYDDWLQTMYVLFGTKFSKIFSGPMRCHDTISQGCASVEKKQDPLNGT